MSWVEDPGPELFRGLNLGELAMDEAYLTVKNNIPDSLWLYSLSEDCYKCPFSLVGGLETGTNYTVSTKRWSTWRVTRSRVADPLLHVHNTSQVVCEMSPDVREFGVYELEMSPSTDHQSNLTCSLLTAKDPVNIYYPLAIWVLILAVLWALCCLASLGWERLSRRRPHAVIMPTSVEMAAEPPRKTPPSQHPVPAPRQRLKSLDTFRGIAIVLMIFVNTGGGGYWFFHHATWNGLHVADLVFPWFMWIMGVCIPISIRSQLRKKVPRLKMLWVILRRSCLLFVLGLCVNTVDGAALERLRLFGVLQRFGLCYLLAASLSTLLTPTSYPDMKVAWLEAVQDVVMLSPQWLVMLGVVGAHTYLAFFFEAPGCPAGYLGPGGNHEEGLYKDCVGGVTGYVDRTVLGRDHIYQHPTADQVYGSGAFDPEGLMGVPRGAGGRRARLLPRLEAAPGALAGLGQPRRGRRWRALPGQQGGRLGARQQEPLWLVTEEMRFHRISLPRVPCQPPGLTTSMSFVMVTTCFAFFLLSACYYVIDVRQWWSGAPFYYPGMNAIIMYVGHEICNKMFPWHWTVGSMNTHMLTLSEDVWATLGWVLVAYWLFSANFFLSL